ncbi:Glutathione import ATP-binding protein GsiA [Solibacillus isronensis B3W22]|uniref:ABC-type dipeptide/oligopeptide/nickel transport system, ATPase component n=2 Tax=Solibacillus TaxID=648800 RepID=F2F686_SOLSS|nr:dipeptide/oligopeptide/nickel ABC transporter ATP-binding protein [Solibacillus silvestris]EKB46941.1 Glutathione import ATP-binding protein GsiA [Solibacillus isronensis B3W22]BAK17490.1 ABC-type dipeptide/oligopeptide/nickel transport system, ATPase component [Solibacillus silvestris StLB046]
MSTNELLEIRNLRTSFRIKDTYYPAVDNVSLTLRKNEILAIVGESGCGKSTLATSVVGLHNSVTTKVEGEILYNNQNLVKLTDEQFNKLRGNDIGFIFQDPLSALNPLMRIGEQIEEGLIYHTKLTKEQREKRVIELLDQVGIANMQRVASQFPHQLSGGMRQRVMIAIALSGKPAIIIADEPTTALDVTIQAQILDLLKSLQDEIQSGIILITHDLGVVAEVADRVAVMYAGEVIEEAPVVELFRNPKHPYTRSLLKSIPQTNSENEKLEIIQGMVPSLMKLPRQGCRFSSRIPWIPQSAHEANPQLHEVAPGHLVRCTCWKDFHFEDEEGSVNQ